MAVDDVAQALIALNDESVRQRARDGDLSALGDLTLTDEERQLITDALAEPEVAGHDFYARQMPAYEYVSSNQTYLSSSVRTSFRSYLQNEFVLPSSWAAMRV